MSIAATFTAGGDTGKRRVLALTAIYAALIVWAFISLFPVYWTITTSFKVAVDVQRSHLIPWVDFMSEA